MDDSGKSEAGATDSKMLNLKSTAKPVTDARTLPKSYNPTIDYTRIVTAILIALFHSHFVSSRVAEASVAFFVITMVYFMLRKLSSGGDRASAPIASGAWRLLRPWAIWTGIYSAAIIVNVTLKHGDLAQAFRDWLPPYGTQGQLWYLLFAAILSLALSIGSRGIDLAAAIERNLLAASLLAAGITAAALTVWSRQLLPMGLAIFFLYLPSALLGMLFFSASRDTPRLLAVAGAATLFGVVLAAFGLAGTSQLILGVPLYLFAYFVRLPGAAWTRSLGGLSMSVFLVHLLVVAFVARLPFVVLDQPGGAAAVVTLSLAAAIAIRWMKLEKYLQ